MASSPAISVVIPVYNEASIVASAVAELSAGLVERGIDYEIVLAENGSTDSTPDILTELSRANPRVRWFHSQQPNYGAALKEGLRQARGELVFCDEIDLCDLSFYDASLGLLNNPKVDMVIGSKTARGAIDQRPWIRRTATRMHNRLLRWVLDFQGTDTHGPKALRRAALLPVVERCLVDRDVFASELVIRAWRAGLSIVEIPIQLKEKRRPSVHLFRRVPSVLRNVAKLVYAIRIRER